MLAKRNHSKKERCFRLFAYGFCSFFAAISIATADCGKIIIIQCPEGIDLNKLLEKLGLPPQGDSNQKPPEDNTVEPAEPGGGGDGEGEVDNLPGGDSNQ